MGFGTPRFFCLKIDLTIYSFLVLKEEEKDIIIKNKKNLGVPNPIGFGSL
jgi:hypothetical protein